MKTGWVGWVHCKTCVSLNWPFVTRTCAFCHTRAPRNSHTLSLLLSRAGSNLVSYPDEDADGLGTEGVLGGAGCFLLDDAAAFGAELAFVAGGPVAVPAADVPAAGDLTGRR